MVDAQNAGIPNRDFHAVNAAFRQFPVTDRTTFVSAQKGRRPASTLVAIWWMATSHFSM